MNLEPLRAITDHEVEAFEVEGAVCLRGMIDRDWLQRLAAGVDRIVASPGPLHTIQTVDGEPGFFLSDICMAQRTPELQEFILNGPVGAIAARIMRSRRINFWADTLWVKEAGTGKRTRWHQDQPFFWVNGKQMCVIWWPLDPVARIDGLELVRGSHRWGKWYAPELSRRGQDLYRADGTAFERMPDIDHDRERFPLLSWTVEPGDCIAFHGVTVHGAAGNSATRRRRAFSTVLMGDDACYGERPSNGRPHFHGHDLAIGAPMDSGYFPRLWPRGAERLEAREFPRFTDEKLQITN